jgi:hypothetical protein
VTTSPPDALPELVIADREGAILELLRELQRATLLHPEAAQGLFSSLVTEGRLFAQTSEGQRWKEKVLRSELLERALLVWQNATVWMTEESPGGTTPSALIDAVAAVAASPRRDLLLNQLFEGSDHER